MKGGLVLGLFFQTYFFGEHWRIIPNWTPGYRVFEVQEAYAVNHLEPNSNRVVIRSGFYDCDIRYKDGGPLEEETANSLVRDIAKKELVDLDEYNRRFCSLGG